MERLKESIELVERLFHGLGFCLSQDGDLLSQWRGYADDARGVAVGFSHSYLAQLASASRSKDAPGFSIHQVEYEPKQHEADIEPTYLELRKLIDDGAFRLPGLSSLLDSRTPEQIAADDRVIEKAHGELLFRVLSLFPKLYELKAEAFREELEWRLVSIFADAEAERVEFRAAGARIVPYRSFELIVSLHSPIVEVVLGPRHQTPEATVQSLLRSAGFGEVKVRRSAATYR
jgi:hypothetical protein